MSTDMACFYNHTVIPESYLKKFEHMYLIRNFFQKNDLFHEDFLAMEKVLVAELPKLENDYQEVECYKLGEISIDEVRAIYRKAPRPIVIRAFAKESDCVRLWTPKYFKEKYGDFKIFFTSTEKIVNDTEMNMRTFIDNVLKGNPNRMYIENMADIFNEHIELFKQIPLEKIGEYLGTYASYQHTQLFIGGLGTGASLHAANELNVFINVYGQKRWHFIHPMYSLCLYPTLQNKGIFVGSPVKHRAPKGYLEKEFPLYNRIPKLMVTLEPGDILLNPPWWWHAVDNVTDATIGIATRWPIAEDYQKQNPLLGDFVQSLHPSREKFKELRSRASDQVVIPDKDLRKAYDSYESMGFFRR